MTDPCVFCEIVAERSPAKILNHYPIQNSIVLAPLNPVVEGHVIVIPTRHISSAIDDPRGAGFVMEAAAFWTKSRDRYNTKYDSVNFITSVGMPATQSINHLHIHIVPRQIGDGLMLPWTNQKV